MSSTEQTKSVYVVDQPPSSDFEFTTYFHVQDNRFKKYGESNTKEEAAKIFSDKELPSVRCLIYMKMADEYVSFERNIH